MNVTRDLGEIDAPLLVCGGAYSNLEALEAVLAEADRRGIEPSHIIHTGDAIAYCADAHAVPARLRDLAIPAIKGNVEQQLGSGASDCGCGFAEGSTCDLWSAQWYAHADREIDADLRKWMAALPDHLTFSMAGLRIRVVHGAPTDINKFQFGSLPRASFEAELDAAGADGVIAGHTGLPFTRKIGARAWHNSGALGMPANDGTPRVWASVLTPANGGIAFRQWALTYDHAKAAEKMRGRGLPSPYADALETGIWPSLDILPEAERTRAGVAITPETLLWSGGKRAAA